jgi:hypothetical protein
MRRHGVQLVYVLLRRVLGKGGVARRVEVFVVVVLCAEGGARGVQAVGQCGVGEDGLHEVWRVAQPCLVWRAGQRVHDVGDEGQGLRVDGLRAEGGQPGGTEGGGGDGGVEVLLVAGGLGFEVWSRGFVWRAG